MSGSSRRSISWSRRRSGAPASASSVPPSSRMRRRGSTTTGASGSAGWTDSAPTSRERKLVDERGRHLRAGHRRRSRGGVRRLHPAGRPRGLLQRTRLDRRVRVRSARRRRLGRDVRALARRGLPPRARLPRDRPAASPAPRHEREPARRRSPQVRDRAHLRRARRQDADDDDPPWPPDRRASRGAQGRRARRIHAPRAGARAISPVEAGRPKLRPTGHEETPSTRSGTAKRSSITDHLEKERQMGKIVLAQNTSVDGVMQSPGSTDVPFKYRGWVLDFDVGPEGERSLLEEAQNADALLLGRVTYEAMQAFWPTAQGEFADRLNELPKYVVSSTLTDPAGNATVLGADWSEEVARLRKELDGDLLVYGSRRLS